MRERNVVATLLLVLTLFLLTACGHKTGLIRPSDIPEYERQRQEKIDKYAPYDPDNQTQTEISN